MKHRLVLMIGLLGSAVACSSPDNVQKGVFELVAEDFTRHDALQLGAALTPGLAAADAWHDTGIRFARGDILLVEASGTVRAQTLPGGDLLTVGPEGQYGWLGGTIYALVNRTPLGLYGRIGDSVFLIGSGAALLAPDTGSLELAVNYCDGCDVQGALDVAIHTVLAPGVALATEPLITDNTIVSSQTLDVAPDNTWLDTGIAVQRGDKLFVDALGQITVDGLLPGTYDGNGNEPWLGGVPYLIPSATAYRLFARVGERIIPLGKSAAFLSPHDGTLELGINTSTGDTITGALQVTVHQGVKPARGLDPLAAPATQATVTLTADDVWTASGVPVTRGTPIVFSGTGALSGPRISAITGNNDPVSPFGVGAMGGTIFLLPSRPAFAVHARVGDQVFFAGGSGVVLAPADGEVELAPNTIRCSICTDCSACTEPACNPVECVDCNTWCDQVAGSLSMTVATP